MRSCPYCGSPLPENARFCGNCGAGTSESLSNAAPSENAASFLPNEAVGRFAASDDSVKAGQGAAFERPDPGLGEGVRASETLADGAPPSATVQSAPQAGSGESATSPAARIFYRILAGVVVVVLAVIVRSCTQSGNTLGAGTGETVVSSSSAASSTSGSSSASASASASAASSAATVLCEYEGLRYEVPASWTERKDGGGYHYRVSGYSGDNFSVLRYGMEELLGVSSAADVDIEVVASVVREAYEDDGDTIIEMQTLEVGGHPAVRFSSKWHHYPEDGDSVDEDRFEIDELVLLDSTIVHFAGVCGYDDRSKRESQFMGILESVTVA